MEENKQAQLQKETHKRVIEELERSLPEGWRVEGNKSDLEQIRILHSQLGEGDMAVKLTPLFAKVEQYESDKEKWLAEFTEKVVRTIREAAQKHRLVGQEHRLYPVLRHPSFTSAEKNKALVWRAHTAESIVLYALDLEASYTLISKEMLAEANMTEAALHEKALDNLRRLESTPKQDKVGDNIFYFFNAEDSYSASRVLNEDLLLWMRQKVSGKMGVALPHQDVLIVADLADAKGAYMLAQLTVDFSMRASVPISPIPFMYEDGGLEPYMVMKNPKSRHKYPSHGGRKKRPPEQ
ncbi:DUF1444 family protein [Aneurinibacillus sp. REN35]|uniref:DUF1444 family protein n=1 Tax=Aneurinibacillus sp. REN35 TaxID=3237286 RepID=UPI00352891C7